MSIYQKTVNFFKLKKTSNIENHVFQILQINEELEYYKKELEYHKEELFIQQKKLEENKKMSQGLLNTIHVLKELLKKYKIKSIK